MHTQFPLQSMEHIAPSNVKNTVKCSEFICTKLGLWMIDIVQLWNQTKRGKKKFNGTAEKIDYDFHSIWDLCKIVAHFFMALNSEIAETCINNKSMQIIA